jgi:2-amino-4-hydroxy-6-hydroxymethyldihydropteridine diphosphokinase
MPPTIAYIGLGSNVGDRHAHLAFALRTLAAVPGMRVVAASEFIETEPVGPIPQGRYLNAAAQIETSLPAREFLSALLEIERFRGRDRAREQRWGPRTIDLDLLLYGTGVIDEPGLTVPHPRLHERGFVLAPLAQIAPEVVVPTLDRTVRELLQRVNQSGLSAIKRSPS